MPNVNVSDWTKDELDAIYEAEDHTSYDSVIKSLLNNYNYNTTGETNA